MADDGSRFRYLGAGEALTIEVTGPTVESCVARAVEGLGNAVATVHPSVACRTVHVALPAASPSALLLAVLDAAGERMACHGEVPVALSALARQGDRVRATFAVAPRSAARRALADRAPRWHGVALRRTRQGWHGVVVADL